MNGGSDSYNPYHFLNKCNENFQMPYVNYFNRFRFVVEDTTKLQKLHFLRTITQERGAKKVSTQGLRVYKTPCALQLVETLVSEYLNFNKK